MAAMDTEAVVAELVAVGKPEGPDQVFYFGLLNQRLKAYASWVQARDAFQELSEDSAITRDQRQLAGIFLQYNQTRINWHAEYRKSLAEISALQDALLGKEEENDLLQSKIKAITDLETTIGTRETP